MKPILSNDTSYAFDAMNDHTIEFKIDGFKEQPIKNKVTICTNKDNMCVYSQIQDTLQLKHVIPANTLTNGTLYNITVQTIDKNNNYSDVSDAVLFYCFTTPNFDIDITPNQIIENSSIDVNLIYSQTDGEELQMFQIKLYSQNKEELSSSGVSYSQKKIKFSGLIDNTTYYIKATGQTINHIEMETNYIPFVVDYMTPNFYSYVVLENRYKQGDIQISSNLISIEGNSSNPVYIDDNFIDTINGTSVSFNNGFNLNKNFTLYFNGYNFQYNEMLLYLSSISNDISIYWRKGIVNQDQEYVYAELICDSNSNSPYIIHSNHLLASSSDLIEVWIIRNNGYYNIQINNMGAR